MGVGAHYCALLTGITALYVIGTLIFTGGFLLSRSVVKENSSCVVDFTHQPDNHGLEGCWMHKRFEKAIIVVIDALRYDFMLYNRSASSEQHYQNKLPFFDELLRKKPMNSRLYRFLADPPTTTLQRLKGLTTGSLPTFVDAGSNFASSEITEDNIIDQMVKLDKKITFLGDDTWGGLFPGRFSRSFMYPSFNVFDLHTVDDGIQEHLLPEIKRKDWDVLITHFLGVDHCGHRFGPNHAEMASKLHQMDSMLWVIVKEMSEDTLLVVMGDHGMTRTGDHGGDSDNELETGIFFHSHSQITSTNLKQDQRDYKTMSQVDFVPTISLLLGAPIPFSNLGIVMTDFFNYCSWWKTGNSKIKQTYHALKALRLNAYQVHRYLQAYNKVSTELPADRLANLEKLFVHTESDLQYLLTAMVKNNENKDIEQRLAILENHYRDYLMDVKSMCQEQWAQFDIPSIVLGITVVLLALLSTITLMTLNKEGQKIISWKSYGCVGTALMFCFCGYFVNVVFQTTISLPMVLVLMDIVVFGLIFVVVWRISKTGKVEDKNMTSQRDLKRFPKTENIFVYILCSAFVCNYFSNSYVVQEDTVSTFLCQTVIIFIGYRVVQNFTFQNFLSDSIDRDKGLRQKRSPRFDLMKFLTNPCSITVAVVSTILFCVRVSAVFGTCREEQHNCQSSPFLTALSDADYKNARYFFSISVLAIVVLSSRFWMRHFGNLNGYSIPVLFTRYAFPCVAVLIGLHWALQGLPAKILDALPSWQQVVLPQLAYGIIIVSFVIIIFSPLTVYMLPSDSQDVALHPGLRKSEVIPSIFNHVKVNWGKFTNEASENKPPVVYGLGSAYSASIVYLVTVIGLLMSMLLQDGLAPGVFLMLFVHYLYLELYSVYYQSQSPGSQSVELVSVIGWMILSTVFFYNTGHQTAITTIPWAAAFTGFKGDHSNNITPALLVGLNVFSSAIIFTVTSPLLLFCKKLNCQILTYFSKSRSEGPQPAEKGDFVFQEDPVKLRLELFRLVLRIILFQGLKLLGSICAAALHRRHLMVWKIFAPRFVFEAVSSFIIFTLCILMYMFVLRVDLSLEKWVARLTKSSKEK